MSVIIKEVSQYSLHFTALDLITDVMVLDVDMLSAAVIDRILCHLDAWLVTLLNHELKSFLVGSSHDLTQQTMDPPAFLNRQTERNVFCLTCRQRNT